jgi:hypothetical protein
LSLLYVAIPVAASPMRVAAAAATQHARWRCTCGDRQLAWMCTVKRRCVHCWCWRLGYWTKCARLHTSSRREQNIWQVVCSCLTG